MLMVYGLALIGMIAVLVMVLKALKACAKCARRRIPRRTLVEQVGIEVLYQAPNRGRIHSEVGCKRIEHLTEKDRVVLSWCSDCRKVVEGRLHREKSD